MSFLSKFRGGGQEKGKASKKEWTPPKLPPPEEPLPDIKNPVKPNVSLEPASSFTTEKDSAIRKTSFTEMNDKECPDVRITMKDTNAEGEISKFSFLREDPKPVISDDIDIPTDVQEKSAFSFLSSSNDKPLPSHISQNSINSQSSKPIHSASVATTPFQVKPAEVTPRKKKKNKVIRPGYGNVDGPQHEIYQKERRSSSTSSASETRSEGFTEEEFKDDYHQVMLVHGGQSLTRSSEQMVKDMGRPFAFISEADSKERFDIEESKGFYGGETEVKRTSSFDHAAVDRGEQADDIKGRDIDRERVAGENNSILDGRHISAKRDLDKINEVKTIDKLREITNDVNVSKDIAACAEIDALGNKVIHSALSTDDVDGENIGTTENACELDGDKMSSIDDIEASKRNELSNDDRDGIDKDIGNENNLVLESERTEPQETDMIKVEEKSESLTSEYKQNEFHNGAVDILNDLKEVLTEQSVASQSTEVSYELSLNQDEQTEIYLETLESREKALRDQLLSMKNTQLETLQSVKKSFYSKQIINKHIKELQEEQTAAVSKDDFALAEKINQHIDQKQNELENLKFKHPLLDEVIIGLVDQCNECLKIRQQECTYLQKEFEDIIKSEEENLRKHIDQNDTSVFKERLKINEEKAKLDREMGHITLDKEHLERNEVQLDDEIHVRTKTFQEDKSQLLKERCGILDEVEDLEARLKILRGKETAINSKIEDIDSQISEAVLDFSPRLKNLRNEKADILEKENCVTSKLHDLTQLEAELKQKQEKEQNFEERCKQNIDMLTGKISSIKNIEEEIGEEQIDLKSIINIDNLRFSRDNEHTQLQTQVKKLENELNAENCKVLETSAQIARLKKMINDIEARVGELEKEKALAVAGRNFKAAKTITEERNALIKDGQESQNKLKELEDKILERDSAIERLKAELCDSRTSLEKTEMELDQRISSSLIDCISKLKAFTKRKKSSLWIMQFITFEISTCKTIIEDIHENYGWPLPEIISEHEGDACDEANENKAPKQMRQLQKKFPNVENIGLVRLHDNVLLRIDSWVHVPNTSRVE